MLKGWAVVLSVPAAGVIAAVILMLASSKPIFWADRLLLLPLAAVPPFMLWIMTIPRLRRIRQATGRKRHSPLDVRLRGRAAQPAVVLPYQLSTLCSLTGLYLLLTSTMPSSLFGIVIPLLVLAVAALGLWMSHLNRSSRIGLTGIEPVNRPWRRLMGRSAIVFAAAAIAYFPFLSLKNDSLLPVTLAMSSGTIDYGIGSKMVAHDHEGETAHTHAGIQPKVSVDTLTGPADGEPDVRFTLTAETKTVTLSSGKKVEAWTFNGQTPGPELRVRQGQLVEVTLINKNIKNGATLHWHGLDVPNAEDGIAGVTQNAVMPGESYTYRFVAKQAGTYWYHSHQESMKAVQRGLFGPLIVEPAEGLPSGTKDINVISHVWQGADFTDLAIGINDGIEPVRIAPGTPVRLRLINTDDWVRQTYRLVGTKFKVAAIDGTEVIQPGDLSNVSLKLTTGGRYDVTFIMPETPVYLAVGAGKAGDKLGLLMSASGAAAVPTLKSSFPLAAEFDPLHYGKPAETPFDANSLFDREFKLVLDNKLGFYNGELGFHYTMNGKLFPDTPMFMVKEGELVKMTIVNRGSVDHPMHLHGHHMLVLSRNGVQATGSPWWSDTLDVTPGDVYEVGFIADNPGIWMDHCHNLDHAAAGMSMHLMYEGVDSPYKIGSGTVNRPE
ncbi:multicopper oxidase family protein [Paenibacillus sp. NPDC058174]|uniref:multicopper oxidase family protein n=1 Tax=Paenibacillus sp. NPDC058174 TaxID=3346366 RepID=UPI0036DDF392